MSNLISVPGAEPALIERIEAWARAADGAYSPQTERMWRAHWRVWSAWCAPSGACALPAHPQAVAAFLRAESAAGRAYGTIQKRMETIHRAHTAAELPSPCRTEVVRLAMRAIRCRTCHQRPHGAR